MNRTQRDIAGATIVTIATIVSAFFLSLNAAAHPLSREECSEGSDFIKNVALSRENGMDGMAFLARTIADFAAIKSFPPALRWFVQDQYDEDYLLKAVADVFSNPRDPQAHQTHFFGECVTRSSSSSD